MSDTVIEIVQFRTKPGVSEADFLAVVPESVRFLKSCPGFIARRLARHETGEWMDQVEWTSMDAAKAADAAFMASPSVRAFTDMIDMSQVSMRHLAVKMIAS